MCCNGLELLNKILDINCKNDDEMFDYMITHQPDCALKIFKSNVKTNYINEVTDAL